MADFHDDFHGSALAHASFTVLQALHGAVGGGCEWRRGREGEEGEEEEEGGRWGSSGQRKEKTGEREGEREDDTVVNEHVHNTQD